MTAKINVRPSSDLFYKIVLWTLLIYGGGYLSYIPPLNVILPIALLVLLFINIILNHVRFTKKEVFTVLFVLAYIIFLYAYHSSMGAKFSSYVNVGIGIISIFFFNKLITDQEKFISLFEKVMLFICIYSCVCYGLNLIFDFTSTTPWTGTLYKLWMGQNIKSLSRNSGPFWEPGIFQIYIVIALYFSLFFFKNKKGKFPLLYILIFGITILTTISTTGYLIMGALLLWKYITITQSVRKIQLRITALFLTPVIFLLVGAIIISTPAVADKFQANNGSFNVRSTEVSEAIPIIRDAGMFGKGANTIARQSLMIRHGIRGNGNTNSVGYSSTASMYGWVTLLLFMFRILFVCWNNFRKQWILLYGIMLITWTTGAVMFIPLYYFFFVGFNVNHSNQYVTDSKIFRNKKQKFPSHLLEGVQK